MVVLLLIFLCHCGNQRKQHCPELQLYKTDTSIQIKIDTVPGRGEPYVVYLVDSFPYPVPQEIDTAAIIASWFTRYVYTDTISDSNLTAISILEIEKNKVLSHALDYKIYPRNKITIIHNTEVLKQQVSWHIGIGAGVNVNRLATFGPEIIYTKNNTAFGGSYDVLNKSPGIKAYYVLRK